MAELSKIIVSLFLCCSLFLPVNAAEIIYGARVHPSSGSTTVKENVIATHLAQSASTSGASSYNTSEDFTEGVPRANSLMLAVVVNSKASSPDTPTFSGFNVTGSVSLTPDHVYWVTGLWNYGYGGKLRIYDPSDSWNQVGSELTLGFGATLQGCNVIDFGRYDNHGAAASKFTYMDDIMIDWTHARFPLGP